MAVCEKRFLVLVLCVLLLEQSECKRKGGGSGGSGRRTTPRSVTRHTTQSHNYNQPSGNNSYFNQQHVYQTGMAPSAPIAPPPASPGAIGFENINRQVGPQPNQHNIGFENVQNRLPPQNNQPNPNIGFNVPPNAGGHQPGFTPNPGYHPGNPNAPGYNNQFGGGYQPGGQNVNNGYQPQFGGGYHPGQSGYQGSQGVYNPGSYYNPQQFGPPPQIYQPVQQSGGGGISSVLGYAGTFAGGYLIGRLTSGGRDSDDKQYTVHHYHNNRDDVPKELSVPDKKLITCNQNATQNLCAPNTFPICLANGTIMCVTHTPYTVPCSSNSSMSCVISVLPCANNDTSCNTANLTTTVVYIPCISNVTVAKRRVQVTDSSNSSQPIPGSDVKLCVTAIAEPKKTQSPVVSLLNFLGKLAEFPFMDNIDVYPMYNVTTVKVPVTNLEPNTTAWVVTTTAMPAVNNSSDIQVNNTIRISAGNVMQGNSTENSTETGRIVTSTESVPVTTTLKFL